MMEWNNDEISKLIDFIEKRSFMYVIRHFSGARNCDELASNFSCKFLVTVSVTSFWYKFLLDAPQSTVMLKVFRLSVMFLYPDRIVLKF